MTEPLVSIIIPTFNSEKYIKRCLTSLDLQTYKQLEIVIVDAHSTDNTLTIIESFKNTLNTRVLTLAKSTQSEARNLGLQHATGEYIAFCDSDDFYLPEKIQQQIDAMENTKLDVTYFDVLHFCSGQEDRFYINQHPKYDDIIAECIANQTINLNSVMIRKNFLDAHALHFPTGEMGRYGEDGNFIFQLAVNHAQFKKIDGNWSVVEVRKDSHTQWEAQWKMKHYAIQYRINAADKLENRYQSLLAQSIKNLKLKLAVALMLVNQYGEAKLTLKSIFKKQLSWAIDITFTLLRLTPTRWVHWVITLLWDKRRATSQHHYVDTQPETANQLMNILKTSTT